VAFKGHVPTTQRNRSEQSAHKAISQFKVILRFPSERWPSAPYPVLLYWYTAMLLSCIHFAGKGLLLYPLVTHFYRCQATHCIFILCISRTLLQLTPSCLLIAQLQLGFLPCFAWFRYIFPGSLEFQQIRNVERNGFRLDLTNVCKVGTM